MGQITVNGNNYDDITAAFPAGQGYPTAGTYYALEPLGNPPCITPIAYDRAEIKFPGLHWTGEKDFGKGKRMIYIELVLFATLAALRGNVQTLLDGLNTNTRFTITLNGQSFQGCKLDAPACGKPGRVNYGNGIVGEHLPLVFKQLSDTN